MFGRVVKLQTFGDASGLGSWKGLVQGRHAVSVQVVEDHANHWGVGIGHVHQPLHLVGEVVNSAPLGAGHLSPARQGLAGQEEVAGAAAVVPAGRATAL